MCCNLAGTAVCYICRYKQFHGRSLEHPLDKRKIPVILDAELVDMDFGTGAVKITPAHDPNDFASGQRHKLASINLYTDDGHINDNGGRFAGQPRFQVSLRWTESHMQMLEPAHIHRLNSNASRRTGDL